MKSGKGTTVDCVRIPTFIPVLWESDKRYNVLYGGGGSGKTHAIVQYLSYMFLTEQDKEFMVSCKTNPTLKSTVYEGATSIIQQLKEWNVPLDTWHNKTNQILKNPLNNNTMYFKSMDDPEKIKSMNLNYVWLEEATSFTFEDFKQVNTRLRRPSDKQNKMWISFNPVSMYNWTWQFFMVNPPEDVRKNSVIHHSTPFDNPFLARETVMSMLSMAERDENYFRVYVQGEPGAPSGLVYNNMKFSDTDEWPKEVWSVEPFYGVDFGWNDPMAFVEVRKYDNRYFVRELFYKSEHTIEQLIDWMDRSGINKNSMIYADSASPERIYKLQQSGYRFARPANKDILQGISTLNASDITISFDSNNLREEVLSYQWKPKSSQSMSDVLRDEPIDANNHACFASGTMITTDTGDVPIERIKVGDMVLTRKGYRKVIDRAMTSPDARTTEYTFSNGTKIRCTPEHPFYVEGRGFTRIDDVKEGDELCALSTRNTEGSCGTDIPNQTDIHIPELAHVRVQHICGGKVEKVYNMTVDEEHEYFANGILVSNCDALRYSIYSNSLIGQSTVIGKMGSAIKDTTTKSKPFIPRNL